MSELVWLVTGANRGIGLEWILQLLQDPQARVVAAARNKDADSLKKLAAEHSADRFLAVALDTTSVESAQAAAQQVEKHFGRLDYLISNAGVFGTGKLNFGVGRPGEEPEPLDVIQNTLYTNVVGPIITLRAFHQLLLKGSKKVVVTISSNSGCISEHQQSAKNVDKPAPVFHNSGIGYAMSKAAVNMGSAVLGAQLKSEGFIVISLHPGWVETDMGLQGGEAYDLYTYFGKPISPSTSVQASIKTTKNLTPRDNGAFKNYTGEDYAV